MSNTHQPYDVDKMIAQNLEFYRTIKPKTDQDDYTVIATLNDANTSELLALATGTQANLRQYENDIEDCHAESLLKRAYKRYLLDKILSILEETCESRTTSYTARLTRAIDQINRQELVLFVSQFPCGLINRFQGPETIDEQTGAVVIKKPGRGQTIDGKIVYVRRDTCLNKIKRWMSTYGLQGRSIKEHLGIEGHLTKLLIGDCEPDIALDYNSQLDLLRRELSASKKPIQVQLVRMRDDEFTFKSGDKQPLPVATVWWASSNDTRRETLEYVVDGRRIGMTKKQCITNGDRLKLRSSDFCLREDLKRILGTT